MRLIEDNKYTDSLYVKINTLKNKILNTADYDDVYQLYVDMFDSTRAIFQEFEHDLIVKKHENSAAYSNLQSIIAHVTRAYVSYMQALEAGTVRVKEKGKYKSMLGLGEPYCVV